MRSFRVPVTLVSVLALLSSASAQFVQSGSQFVEGPLSLEVVDLDQDGDRDVLLGARSGVSVLWNQDGQGDLSAPELLVATEVTAHAVDVNGDGAPDLVCSQEMNGGIRWYRNLGIFGLGPAQTIDGWNAASKIRSADVDLDGDLDLILALENNSIVVMANTDGNGTFGPMEVIAAQAGITDLACSDLNGDGNVDVHWSSASAGQVHAAHGTGTGGFASPQVLSPIGHGVMADLNGDGASDLALADPLSGAVSWRKALQGNFGPALPIDLPGVSCDRLLATDLGKDGGLDLLVALDGGDELAWYENTNAQGEYGPKQLLATGWGGIDLLAVGDLNGDGDAEVFAASGASQSLFWFENLAVTNDRIVGRVFNDLNGDGEFNGLDHGLYNIPVHVAGLGTTWTNHSGVYQLAAPAGTHQVTLSTPSGWAVNGPSTRSASVAAPSFTALDQDFPMTTTTIQGNLDVELTSSPLRCDQQVPYWLTVTNTGNQVSDVWVTLQLDPHSTFVSASPQPDTVIAGSPAWSIPALQPTHHRVIDLEVHLPDWQYMGVLLSDQASAQASVQGYPLGTFLGQLQQVLTCSYDPNDKRVSPAGQGSEGLVAVGTSLEYTVRFQNTGSAPAWDVRIIDLLDQQLDPASVRVLASSHAMQAELSESGELSFLFERINLPDSASDPSGSQGFVTFLVDHLPGISEGAEVTNTASIYFDTNPAIVTNTVLNTLTYGVVGIAEAGLSGGLEVHPNPVQDNAVVRLGEEFQGRTDLLLNDALGRTVRAWSISGDRAELRREDLPRGLYLLRAVGREGTERVVRVLMD